MEYKELETLEKLEHRLSLSVNSLENLMPIWYQTDKKKKILEAEIKSICEERDKLRQGQMTFDEDF